MSDEVSMARAKRITRANYVYHVLNRGAKKALLFAQPSDYRAFQELLLTAKQRVPMRILAYCLMPNHWHLLLWPSGDGDLSRFMRWLTVTHASRWARAHECVGHGAVYQSRFKSIPIECGSHLFWTWRYVERNALRANLVSKAEDWPWCSLQRRIASAESSGLDAPPVPLPDNWTEEVNSIQTNAELEDFRKRMKTGRPFGHDGWFAKQPLRGRPALRKS